MANPTRLIADQLATRTSRGGFITTLGKFALLGGAAVAGLRLHNTYAQGPCQCEYPCCTGSCGGTSTYVGCCKDGSVCYATYQCKDPDGAICYYQIESGCPCPQVPSR